MTGEMARETSDDGAAAPRAGGGGGASCDPPTGSAHGRACPLRECVGVYVLRRVYEEEGLKC